MNIWKFPLKVVSVQTIDMPAGARWLTVQMQSDVPCIWALVDPTEANTPRVVRIVGTGFGFNGRGAYLGTFQLVDGTVWHVFEIPIEKEGYDHQDD